VVEVRAADVQVDDVLAEIRATVAAGERVLVTVLTKRMAQELTDYYQELDVRARYLHSDIDTIERMEILRDLRAGEFDVLIGINLLREGLDLPEVSLVCILDADKEGFLRNQRSLIQTMGRAARNAHGRCILYASRVTDSMKTAMDETARRRTLQHAYNQANGITPTTILRPIDSPLAELVAGDYVEARKSDRRAGGEQGTGVEEMDPRNVPKMVERLRKDMRAAAKKLDFERAATLRDRIKSLEEWALELRG